MVKYGGGLVVLWRCLTTRGVGSLYKIGKTLNGLGSLTTRGGSVCNGFSNGFANPAKSFATLLQWFLYKFATHVQFFYNTS
jgi:hypothetical protein